MSYGSSSELRNLVPKGYHFDAYNELNSPNSRDRPFFENGVVPLGEYYLTKTLVDEGQTLILRYSSVCSKGNIKFGSYKLTFDKYVAMLQKALQEKSDFIVFDIPVCYLDKGAHVFCISCDYGNDDCKYLRINTPDTVSAAVSFKSKDIKNALSVHFGITQSTNTSKGGNNMKTNSMKKMLGMNFEFGVSRDSNIAATFMGVAIRNPDDGNWYVFDSATHTIKNYANMKFGDFKVLLVPDRVLHPNDLIKMSGRYYFVQNVEGNMATLLDAQSHLVVTKLLSDCIIPGMNFYTKVVALDPRTMFDPSSQTDMSKNVLAAICMMQWSKGETEFSLDNINDDSFNGLGMLLMMGGNNGLSNMLSGEGGISLPLLLAMGGGNGNDDANGMIQYMIISQMLGGGDPANAGQSLLSGIPGLTPAVPATPAVTDSAGVYCPNCNAEYPAGTNFCAQCGTPTQVKGKHCTNCGAVLMDGAVFCQNCGQKVVRDTCPVCNAKVTEGAKFCSACGQNLNGPYPKTVIQPSKGAGGRRRNTGKKNAPKGATTPNPAPASVDPKEAEAPAEE